jgi:uncharacterized Zn-finger protein
MDDEDDEDEVMSYNNSSNNLCCPICHVEFGAEIALEAHILAVHPSDSSGQELPLMKCDSCPAIYPTYQSLKLHKYLHHRFHISSVATPTLVGAEKKYPLVETQSPSNMTASLQQVVPSNLSCLPLVPSVTSAMVKDKDLADVQSILSITHNFPGMKGSDNSLGGGRSITSDKSRDQQGGSCSSLRSDEDDTEMEDEYSSGNMRQQQQMDDLEDDDECGMGGGSGGFLDDDPIIKEMKIKGEFPCSQCPAVFPNLRALKGHNKEHLGKAPYRCNVGKCAYTSNDKSTLTRHMRRHTGEKPFECRLCNFGFTTKANCERHLKNKHRKVSREEIRDCLIIHETEDTEVLISRMQMNGDVTITASRDNNNHSSVESIGMENASEPSVGDDSDLAFRCKVCKLTFMSRFAVIQHGIHTHPEYAKDIDHIAEAVGGHLHSINNNNNNKFGSEYPPTVPTTCLLAGITSPSQLNGHQRISSLEEESNTPLDLSKEKEESVSGDNSDTQSYACPSQTEKSTKNTNLSMSPLKEELEKKTLSPPMMPPLTPAPQQAITGPFPPGFPLLLPGLAGGPHPPSSMLYSYLAAMPYLLGQQGLISSLQQQQQQQHNGSKFFGNVLHPCMPGPPTIELSSLLAAQELARKKAEFLQQREAAEALQNLSQQSSSRKKRAPSNTTLGEEKKPVLPMDQSEAKEPTVTVSTAMVISNGNGENEDLKNNNDDSMFKMVIKNGVLMKKPKQKRYRTERPYSCQSCNAKFTLRSNMERHIKQQHPECWSSRGRGSGGRKSLAATSLMSAATPPALTKFSPFPLATSDRPTQFTQHRNKLTIKEVQQKSYNKDVTEDEGTDNDEKDEDGMLIIDDKPELGVMSRTKRKLEMEEEEEDLASVKKLLNTATNQNFEHYFPGQKVNGAVNDDEQMENSAISDEEEEAGHEQSGDEGKKSSAYSAAPHKIDCPFCPRQFPWTSSLNRHILTHTGQKPYKCQDCQLWFTTKSNRDRHQVRKHGGVLDATHISRNVSDRPFKCNKCPVSTFATEENLIRHHYEKHLNIECPAAEGSRSLAEITGLQNDNLAIDVDEEDEDEAQGVVEVTSYFKCHLCGEDFLHRAQTIAHVEDEHAEAYRENIGLYEAASRIPIDFHNSGAKREPKEEPAVIRVNCIFCPCQFKSPVELAKHVLCHTRIKQYICDLCREELPSRLELIRHKRQHDMPTAVSSTCNNGIGEKTSKIICLTTKPTATDDLPDRAATAASGESSTAKTTTGNSSNASSSISGGSLVTKRANLMDKINRLSLLSAAKASGQTGGGSPMFSQQEQVVAD